MKLSVFMPSIRTHLLEKWFDSLSLAVDDFEAVVCGPFDPPQPLLSLNNFTFIKSFASPTVCAQRAALACSGEYIYHTTDDVLFLDRVISEEITKIKNDDIAVMRYNEGQNYSGQELYESYWYAAEAYKDWPGVNQNWGIGIHFIMTKDLFLKYGGFDCQFEYLNHATHDLLFRIQKNEKVNYKLSSKVASTADWVQGTSGDHAPIHFAQLEHDNHIFRNLWYGGRDVKIMSDNWLVQPELWTRRFRDTNIKRYEDL